MKRLRIACIQNNAGPDLRRNLKLLEPLIAKGIERGAQLIALPENFSFRGPSAQLKQASEETADIIRFFREIARRFKVAFVLGSVIEPSPKRNKFFNTSVLISPVGKITAKYRKIHLFDNQMKSVAVRESRHIQSGGTKTVCVPFLGWKAGLSICYDLRFPELYRQLSKKGANLIFIPSNFTEKTGKAHWELLVRARAVENQAFVIAPGLTGTHPENKIKSFGTSLIVDPWGRILARGNRNPSQVVMADLDPGLLKALRRRFPVLTHRRLS